MDHILRGLNPQQRAAVETLSGPLMILAGAGTGKTRVITVRIANLLHHRIDPAAIVAVTFTNKAAKEMRERLTHLVGGRSKSVFMGTFHRYCIKILRKFHEAAGLKPDFVIISAQDQVDLVRRCLEEYGWAGDYDAKDIHAQISAAKNKYLFPDSPQSAFRSLSKDPAILTEIYGLYERQLRINRGIDFDDCILKTLRMLRENPLVTAEISRNHQHLLVDEFQDTNLIQLDLLEIIAKDSRNICVVGDDDQSIYSWRGAMYETLEEFERRFPEVSIIKLEQNYRSTNVILQAANTVIKNNNKRKEKALWSRSQDETPITLHILQDEREEARWIARKCLRHLGQGQNLGSMAILYRANSQAKLIELALREANLRYQVYGGQSFFDRKEIQDFLAYLRLIINNSDNLSLWRIINTPNRGIGTKTIEKIEHLSHGLNRPPFEALSSPTLDANPKILKTLQNLHAEIKSLHPKMITQPSDLRALAEAIIKKFHLIDDIRSRVQNPMSQLNRIENLRGMADWLEGIGETLISETGQCSEIDLLDHLCLDEGFGKKKKDSQDSISLMTIHAAKGLEFETVFVAGLDDEQIPHKNSRGSHEGICEERRLFYVALTRAKTNLYLCSANSKGNSRVKVHRQKSRFISEMPSATIVYEGTNPAQPSNKTHTLKTLAFLRSEINQ